MPSPTDSATSTAAPHVPTFAMALCCGLAVANIYYNQPMLAVIEQQLGRPGISGLVPTATQLGYALGLLLLVPLGDLVERRRLIVLQFIGLSLTLVAAAMAPGAWTLVAASLAIGVLASVAQQIVPFAAALAPPASRGKVIGKVMSGLLCGILFSRALSGLVASHWGWREMFGLSVPLALVGAAIMASKLPRSEPKPGLSYPKLLSSLGKLWMQHAELRRATVSQGALFASFTSFWTILSLHLAEPSLGYGSTVAGLFGIIGAVGVFAAPLAGHMADRRGPHVVIAAGAVVAALSWLMFGLWPGLIGLIAGVVLLDFGVQSSLVSNQHLIYALDESARNRLNTVFMGGMFIGGSIGSAIVTMAWHADGWRGTCLAGAGFAVVAVALQLAGITVRRKTSA